MTRKRSVRWNEAMSVRLREMWPNSLMPLHMMAQELGVTKGSVSRWAKLLGLPSRKAIRGSTRRFVSAKLMDTAVFDPLVFESMCFRFVCEMDEKAREYCKTAAERRGLNVDRLFLLLLNTVANERMIDAILDDADELAVRSDPERERSS